MKNRHVWLQVRYGVLGPCVISVDCVVTKSQWAHGQQQANRVGGWCHVLHPAKAPGMDELRKASKLVLDDCVTYMCHPTQCPLTTPC